MHIGSPYPFVLRINSERALLTARSTAVQRNLYFLIFIGLCLPAPNSISVRTFYEMTPDVARDELSSHLRRQKKGQINSFEARSDVVYW